MRPIGLIIMIWMLGLGFSNAQVNKDFLYYNQQTYDLYLSGEWQALIIKGKESIREGYDFYYLRQRIGIAYYQLKQYGKAVPHFYAALDFDKENLATQEYLYYALLFSGRAFEARIFAKAAGQQSAANISVLGSYKWSDQSTIVDALAVYSVNFSHPISDRLWLTHALEYINQQFVEVEQKEVDPPNGNGPPRLVEIENRYNYDQNLYRLMGNFQLGRGWQAGFTVQNIWGENDELRFNQQAYWLYLGKSFSILQLNIEGGYANFSQQDIYQWGVNAIVYPLSNTNVYYQAEINFKNNGEKNQHWLKQRIGFRLSSRLWVEGLFDFGEMNYFQEEKGVIAYNIADLIRSRVGGNLQYWPNESWMLFLQFQIEQKTYAPTQADYQHQGILLGINLNW